MDLANVELSWHGDSRALSAQVIVALDPQGRVAVQRDLDLIKEIALRVQAKNDLTPRKIEVEGPEPWVVARHVELMVHAGLLEASDAHRPHTGPPIYLIRDLTNEGHDFVGALRTPTVWERLKALFPPAELQKAPLKAVAVAATKLFEVYMLKRIGEG